MNEYTYTVITRKSAAYFSPTSKCGAYSRAALMFKEKKQNNLSNAKKTHEKKPKSTMTMLLSCTGLLIKTSKLDTLQ